MTKQDLRNNESRNDHNINRLSITRITSLWHFIYFIMITKTILIKPADNWLVRVWDNELIGPYKDYEVHYDYEDKFLLETLNCFKYELDEKDINRLIKGVELNPELIDFKEEEFPKWSGIFKTYAILNEQKQIENDIWIELFNDLDMWSVSTKSAKYTPIKINELKEKYTLIKNRL